MFMKKKGISIVCMILMLAMVISTVTFTASDYAYATESSSGTVYKVKLSSDSSKLNVRSGPGTSYDVLGKLTNGSTVTVYSISDGWAQIDYNGQTGYVSASYLTAVHTHSWDEGVVTTEPTTEAEGTMTYTCTGCGQTYTESIEKLEPEPEPVEPGPYTVTFDANGGEGTLPEDIEVTEDNGAVVPEAELTKTGYTLTGWYLCNSADSTWYTTEGWLTEKQISAKGAEKVLLETGDSLSDVEAQADSQDTMYAQWRANTFTIVYDANGGEGTMDSTTVTYGVSTALNKNAFTNGTEGFLGWHAYRESDGTWYTKSNGWQTKEDIEANGYAYAVYGDGASVAKTSPVDGDTVTMYAQWGTLYFTVTYNANGGSGTMGTTRVEYGVSTKLAANEFTKSGYTFAGWYAYRTSDKKWYTTKGWYTASQISANGYTKATYLDQASVAKTSSVYGDTIIMYAQWIKGAWTKASGTWTFAGTYGTFKSNKMYAAYNKIKSKSSSTSYYIVVDCTACETYIFKGSAGKWEPFRKWSCAPGRSGCHTVEGTFTTAAKGYSFSTDYCTCYYYTQFKGNYLFHSILYKKGTKTVSDARTGQQLSHGCVRLATDNAKWIYDNIPKGTKVLTYY